MIPVNVYLNDETPQAKEANKPKSKVDVKNTYFGSIQNINKVILKVHIL